ncbi:MAG: dinitrogenase iron-molybdenum cofactor biosynthesis protein [Magnetococcales bacterium]|nr:dinitrogenase iron-molybdenum cofactor biosynthesis protein [Magnetococcales bacterium]
MTVSVQELTEELALRIGLASRELSLPSPRVLITRLQELFGGQLPDQERLKTLTPCQLRPLLQQDLPDLTGKTLKSALHWLTSWEPEVANPVKDSAAPVADHPPDGVVRVAMASMGHGRLDGHFASCSHFMIHDVTSDGIRRVTERALPLTDEKRDKVESRLALIRDCRILVATSIGGPAAARVTRAGLLPLKVTDGMTATAWLEDLRQVLATTPPPWLKRIMHGD